MIIDLVIILDRIGHHSAIKTDREEVGEAVEGAGVVALMIEAHAETLSIRAVIEQIGCKIEGGEQELGQGRMIIISGEIEKGISTIVVITKTVDDHTNEIVATRQI